MALNEVGLLVYSQGFAMSRDEYIIRELAFCDWTGHHHALFKYLLPKGVSYHPLSEEAKTRVDRQTKTVHGLPFEPYTAYNRHDFHPYHQIQDDITRWCQQYLTPQRGRLGVFTLNGLYGSYRRGTWEWGLARSLRARTGLSNEWMVTSPIPCPAHPRPSQCPTRAVATTV